MSIPRKTSYQNYIYSILWHGGEVVLGLCEWPDIDSCSRERPLFTSLLRMATLQSSGSYWVNPPPSCTWRITMGAPAFTWQLPMDTSRWHGLSSVKELRSMSLIRCVRRDKTCCMQARNSLSKYGGDRGTGDPLFCMHTLTRTCARLRRLNPSLETEI